MSFWEFCWWCWWHLFLWEFLWQYLFLWEFYWCYLFLWKFVGGVGGVDDTCFFKIFVGNAYFSENFFDDTENFHLMFVFLRILLVMLMALVSLRISLVCKFILDLKIYCKFMILYLIAKLFQIFKGVFGKIISTLSLPSLIIPIQIFY